MNACKVGRSRRSSDVKVPQDPKQKKSKNRRVRNAKPTLLEDVVDSKLLEGLLSNLVILEGKLKSPTETLPDY
jgi:hypothetical protein